MATRIIQPTRTLTESEKDRAARFAHRDAELLGILLLIALEKKDAATVRLVRWDASLGQFYFQGKAVSITLVRSYLERIQTKLGRRLLLITQKLERGEITIDQWQVQFEETITSAHILAASLALGGIGATLSSTKMWAIVGQELSYADGFKKEVVDGKAGSYLRIAARARSYMQATHITFEVLEQNAREAVGVQTEAMRVRRAAESCKACVQYSYRWIPIKQMPVIGSLICGRYCKCYLIFR